MIHYRIVVMLAIPN